MPALDRLLTAFLAHLEVERGLSPHTLDAYGRDCRRFVDGLPQGVIGAPDRIGEEHVVAFLVAERRRGSDVPSVRRRLSAVKTFLRFLVKERVLAKSPVDGLETPRTWEKLPVVLGVDQVRRLLEAIDGARSRYPRRDRALLELLYASGLRVSEACSLERRDLRRDLGLLRCVGKGGRERIAPVSRSALRAIDDYESAERPRLVGTRETEILFVSRSGRRLGRENVLRLLRRYALRAGLPGHVTPHTLRHSMATHLLRGGADLRVVQEILGHAKLETTEIYTHVDRSDLKKAHRRYHPRG